MGLPRCELLLGASRPRRTRPLRRHAYFAAYPVAQEFPLLPPTYLVLHAPFQIVAFPTAATAMTAIGLLGIVALSAWVLSLARYPIRPVAVLAVSGLAILSNGGRNLLFSGQSSLVFIAGAYLAITSVRVAPGSIGVFVALIKPSFGLPVAALLAASGRWRRAVVGSAAAFVVSAVLMVPFIVWSGGIGELVDTLSDNVAFSAASEWVSLETTTGRVDLAATIAMVTGLVPSGVGEIRDRCRTDRGRRCRAVGSAEHRMGRDPSGRRHRADRACDPARCVPLVLRPLDPPPPRRVADTVGLRRWIGIEATAMVVARPRLVRVLQPVPHRPGHRRADRLARGSCDSSVRDSPDSASRSPSC